MTARVRAGRPLARRWSERGTGLVGTLAGVLVFLVLMLFAVQLATNLYATTTVTAAGFDAARVAASKDVDRTDAGAVAAARWRGEQRFRSLLGATGDRAELTWLDDAYTVRLHISVDAPTILPRSFGGVAAFGHIERTFEVHIEELR